MLEDKTLKHAIKALLGMSPYDSPLSFQVRHSEIDTGVSIRTFVDYAMDLEELTAGKGGDPREEGLLITCRIASSIYRELDNIHDCELQNICADLNHMLPLIFSTELECNNSAELECVEFGISYEVLDTVMHYHKLVSCAGEKGFANNILGGIEHASTIFSGLPHKQNSDGSPLLPKEYCEVLYKIDGNIEKLHEYISRADTLHNSLSQTREKGVEQFKSLSA